MRIPWTLYKAYLWIRVLLQGKDPRKAIFLKPYDPNDSVIKAQKELIEKRNKFLNRK